MCLCVRVCVRERGGVREEMCVTERERERERECVCVCEREREREREFVCEFVAFESVFEKVCVCVCARAVVCV